MNEQIEKILIFWFGNIQEENYGKPRMEWFMKDANFDQEIKNQFFDTYKKAKNQELNHWQESQQGVIALILLLDQFPRNLFRNDPQAFATDHLAIATADYAINRGFDEDLLPVQRWFIYIPFEHSENIEHQRYCLELFAKLKQDPHSQSAIEFAQQHYDIIKKFGRFPHRNQILGRLSTQEEIEFLTQPNSSF